MLVKRPRGLIAAGLVLASIGGAPASADDACPGLFADGRVPVLTNPKLAVRTVPLCFEAFAVLHLGVTRTPLYAAEHLTRGSVAEAQAVARDDSFHEESRLPPDARASLEAYVRSGFDRGHLAPAGDMPTVSAQAESFTLANVVPQNRVLNRGLWADIEEGVRRLATRRGSVFVVTGAIFAGDAVQQIKGGVLVPTQLFKALYDPETGQAGAYLAPNDGSRDWRTVPSTTSPGPPASTLPRPSGRGPHRRADPARAGRLRALGRAPAATRGDVAGLAPAGGQPRPAQARPRRSACDLLRGTHGSRQAGRPDPAFGCRSGPVRTLRRRRLGAQHRRPVLRERHRSNRPARVPRPHAGRGGLAQARRLRETLEAIVRALEAGDLPEAVAEAPEPKPKTVRNPFA